jgi:hypothetical protein
MILDEERSGSPFIVNNVLVRVLTKIFLKGGPSQFQNFRVN